MTTLGSPAICPDCSKPRGFGDCAVCVRHAGVMGEALGGLRAWQTFLPERFEPTPVSLAPLEAVKAFNPNRDNLFLFGPSGTGKSHLAAIGARRFLPTVVTAKPTEIARTLRSFNHGADQRDYIQHLGTIRVLVIDDLGVERLTEAALVGLYEIIEKRYQNRPGGLIVTANLSMGQIAEKQGDDRIPSRLTQMFGDKIFSLDGEPDRRVTPPKAKETA